MMEDQADGIKGRLNQKNLAFQVAFGVIFKNFTSPPLPLLVFVGVSLVQVQV